MNYLTSVSRKIRQSKGLFPLLWCLISLGGCIVYFSSTGEDVPIPQLKNQTISENHVLCVLVPYRDRFEELLEFVPHLSKFLNRQSISYRIIVVNHLPDGYRFNKGSSFNAGFLLMRKKFPECDYIALHDIDTLPLANEVSYAYPGDDGAYHGIPTAYHPVPLYTHPDYIGGILLMSNNVFSRMNGFGNNFWGWGLEDVDFHRRMVKYSVGVTRPIILSTDRNSSFKHIHGKLKQRDLFWCRNQLEAFNNRDNTDHTGLSDVNFTIASETDMIIGGFPCYIFNINIKCIFEVTPWCRPFCRENTTTLKTVWDMDGEYLWPFIELFVKPDRNANFTLWDRLVNQNRNTNSGTSANSLPWDRLVNRNINTNSGISASSLSWNRLMNRNTNSNSGMSANSMLWDRLLGQAPTSKNKK